jgi:hypothetical protein
LQETSSCNGSSRLNSSKTSLSSKLQAGCVTSIPATRSCGCHTRRFTEAYLFRLAAL